MAISRTRGTENAEVSKTLKEGERILAPTRRPDGTLRKPIRIRAGYVPQDEVAIYQSKGAIWKKEMAVTQEVPPGYDPVVEEKPKSKAAKRNEKKKEKRQQAALEKSKNSEQDSAETNLDTITSTMDELSLSGASLPAEPSVDSTSCSVPRDQVQDIDKKIRALKKKIRIAEEQKQKTGETDMKPEQLEKLAKVEGWRSELKLLEDKKAEMAQTSS